MIGLFNISQNGEIKLTRGDSAKIKIDVIYEDGKKYIPSQGDVLTLTVKKKTTDKNSLISKKADTTGTIEIKPKDTEGFNFGVYKYDVEITTEKGDVYTIITPTNFHICEEVTY